MIRYLPGQVRTVLQIAATLLSLAFAHASTPTAEGLAMDRMWGDAAVRSGADHSERTALFENGNFGMFIHWGLYSHLGGKWKDQTFYGIGEWIKLRMNIPDSDYMALASEFDPRDFDADKIVALAKGAGMKWIIISAKHHEGFAMFKSAHPFNIVDATPFARDPMKELADACRKAGLGFGFYYSHNQDWTAPGGNRGPVRNPDGTAASFEQYFREKCLPQVKEICTQYGPLDFIWFDTPGDMPRKYAEELAEYVGKVQPTALLCSRIGHGMGDYLSKGDMEVPPRRLEGLWETCDTTNDSWSFAWYDQNWKDSREILRRLVATVARGGTYLLNVGPDSKGSIPSAAEKFLLKSGEWIRGHPHVVYDAGPSPWDHAMPWGDVTTQGNTLNLVVFDWPAQGRLMLPGLQSTIASATVIANGTKLPVAWEVQGAWTVLQLPAVPPDSLASVITVTFGDAPVADSTLGVFPTHAVNLLAEFAEVSNATKSNIRWMEKFGEWKHATQVSDWKADGRAVWQVEVAEAGDYRVELNYKGEDRLVWRVETEGGGQLQNQQNSSPLYQFYPFGLLQFSRPGRHTISVSLIEGSSERASLQSVRLVPVR